jgi:hypothetical protein
MLFELVDAISGLGTEIAVVTGTMVLTGIFTGWLGYRIRYRGDVHLISGYRDGMAADTEALSRTVGRAVLAVAAVTVLAGLLYPVLNSGSDVAVTYWSGYAVVVLVLSGYAVLAGQRCIDEP